MPKPLKLGIAGAGSIAIRAPLAHLALGDFKDQVTVTAICDPVSGRAKAAAEKYGVPQHYEDYDEMLTQGDFEALTICSPIGVHYEQGLKAVKAGKHVHFNKSITTTKSEADEIIQAAAKTGAKIVSSPGQMLRPQNLRIRKMIQDGALGVLSWAAVGAGFGSYHEEERVRSGNDILSNINPSWYFRKPGGGPLYDMTVYGLHTLTGVLGPAKRVTAMSGVLLSEREFRGEKVRCDADDNTLIVLDFGNARFAFAHGTATGMVNTMWGYPNYYGTKGQLIGVELNGKRIDYPGKEKDPNGDGTGLTKHAVGKHPQMEEMHVFEDVMQLVDLVREGIPSPATAEHARHVVEIFEAAYRAAATGKAQELASTFTPPEGK
jgi:predicted dehydrogenase